MQKLGRYFQFFQGLLLCLLPSLAMLGNFPVSFVCALVSPLFCTLMYPLCDSNQKLWLFIWVSLAMTAPDLFLAMKAAPLVSALLHAAVPENKLFALLFLLLYVAEQLVYAGALRLIHKWKPQTVRS